MASSVRALLDGQRALQQLPRAGRVAKLHAGIGQAGQCAGHVVVLTSVRALQDGQRALQQLPCSLRIP